MPAENAFAASAAKTRFSTPLVQRKRGTPFDLSLCESEIWNLKFEIQS
jgi:hypothetical protein